MTGIAAIGFAAVGKRDCSAFVRGSGSDRARVAQDAVSGVAVASPAVEELGLRRSRSRSPSGEVRKVVPGAGGNVCCRAIQIIGQTRRGVALLAGAAAAGVVPRVVSPHIVHAIGTRRHDGINLRFTCSGVCGSTSCPGYGVCIGSGILGSQQITRMGRLRPIGVDCRCCGPAGSGSCIRFMAVTIKAGVRAVLPQDVPLDHTCSGGQTGDRGGVIIVCGADYPVPRCFMMTDEGGTRCRSAGTHKFAGSGCIAVALCAETELSVCARHGRTYCHAGEPGAVHAKIHPRCRRGLMRVMAGIALYRFSVGYYARSAYHRCDKITVAGVIGYGRQYGALVRVAAIAFLFSILRCSQRMFRSGIRGCQRVAGRRPRGAIMAALALRVSRAGVRDRTNAVVPAAGAVAILATDGLEIVDRRHVVRDNRIPCQRFNRCTVTRDTGFLAQNGRRCRRVALFVPRRSATAYQQQQLRIYFYL